METFSYTAKRSTYLGTVAALLFVLLAEGSLITYVITVFIHGDAWLKMLPVAIISTFLLYLLFGGLLAPLYTKHQLAETYVWLHYGFALNIQVPRSEIASALPVKEPLNMLQPFKAAFDAKKQRVVAAFSDQGQVLLLLKQAQVYKVAGADVSVKSILLNVDKREEFLAALAIPVAPQKNKEHDTLEPRGKSVPLVPVSVGATAAIRTEALTRQFKGFKAVDTLNLSIAEGEIYGFLGSNGAGKTTTIKLLVGLLEPTSGQCWIAGHNVWKEPLAAKAACGYVADRAILYERLSGREFLHFLGQVRALPLSKANERIEYLLDLLELTEHADRPCGAYSFGMKRKLSLAGALLHQPPVLVLDEPLNGLDPRSMRRLKDLFSVLAASGTTILLSTHDLATAEAVCHRIGIIHRGHLRAEGTASELAKLAAASDLEEVFLSLTSDQQEEALV